MDLNLSHQRVLITGGSKGIGYAIAEAFLIEGANVTIVARSAKALKNAADKLFQSTGRKPKYYSFDLSEVEQRKELYAKVGEIEIKYVIISLSCLVVSNAICAHWDLGAAAQIMHQLACNYFCFNKFYG